MTTKSANIAGGGKQTIGAAIGKTGVRARAVQLNASGAGCLIGGSEVDPGSASPVVAATGFPVPSTRELYLPYSAIWTDMYEFDQMYVYVPNGVTLDLLYEQG